LLSLNYNSLTEATQLIPSSHLGWMICGIDPAKSPPKDITGFMSFMCTRTTARAYCQLRQEPIVHNGEVNYA